MPANRRWDLIRGLKGLSKSVRFFRLFIPCIFCTYCNKVTNGCNCLFCVFISFIFTLHVSGSHKPIIRGVSSCFFLYTTIWFMRCLCCSSACACGPVCRDGSTVPPRQTGPQAHADEQHKHCINQMVVYKNSLRHP